MKASVGVLCVSFLCVCVAEVHVQPGGVLEDLQARLTAAEEQLEALRNTIQGSRVAFGAALGDGGHVGPIPAEIALIYKNVYTNTGAYDPQTGIFTAPVSGVYHFSVTGHSLSAKPIRLRLMRNARQVAAVRNDEAGERYETATNSMVLQLRAGETVRVMLGAMTWVYDTWDGLSTFTGHLLFPL